MPIDVKQMIAAAEAVTPRIAPTEALALLATGEAVAVDVRDAGEIAVTGSIAGAVHISRGLLEFCADPATPYHDPRLDPGKVLLLYCASGRRSALAGHTLRTMGFARVFNLGSFADWLAAGGPVERVSGGPRAA